MNGEIDLELYTISLIRLNTAFQKLDNICEASTLMNESADDLERFYNDVIDDLNREEVNFGEYYPFFENGKQTFPQYINALGEIENDELEEVVDKLINIFNNLNRIAEAFPTQGGLNE
ncbi:hypothetical protein [uncultured Methanobrevibacter sp.]|uniref:hypothetical protein n=1 Tax=uncultured Methanobrevibacter sp. TaxID=253161 RepID=UPI0026293B16|nr:hypothetical protein [uncultured Methanobrevibacter sp.]